MKPSILSTIYLTPTTNNEIKTIIKGLNLNSLNSLDIKVKILKLVVDEVSNLLSFLINIIFATGKFPNCLKLAYVTPIYKSDDAKLFSNYRPISVLPILSKIVEKCIYSRLISFISKHNILCDSQYGFRKGYSTNLALINYHNNLTTKLHDNNFVISLFIDLKKAFDTINHKILISKLSHYGIRGMFLNLLINYLSDRTQVVKLCYDNKPTVYSVTEQLICGVPQGSILGPLFFLLYINDMPNISPTSDFILYADDTTITESHPNLVNLQNKINTQLTLLHTWLITNRLTINISKTNFILFTPKNKHIPFIPEVKINSVSINQVYQVKFLGLIIDNKLSWHPHINYLLKKVSKNMCVLYKLRGVVSADVMRNMYYSFIYPLLTYGVLLWGHSYKSSTTKLFLIQKRALRIINNQSYLAHTSSLFKNSKILKLNDIVTHETLKFIFKFKLNLLPNSFNNYFKFIESNTRQNSLLAIPRYRTNYRAFSIQIQGAKIYNQFCCHYGSNFESVKCYNLNALINY